MASSTFGSGWPNCDRTNIVTLVRKDGLRIPLHRELAPLVAILMDLTEAAGYNIRPDWTWGYACRPIAGTNQPSNHSWGTAVDINAPVNPRKQPLTTNIPQAVRKLWKDNGFRWGGDYTSSTPDPMHFEFMGSVADARAVTARLKRFLGSSAPPPPRARPRPSLPAVRPYPGIVRLGDHGTSVKVWQQLLRDRGYAIRVDGIFGPATFHFIMDWQTKHLPLRERDGVGGPVTWHSLLFA